MKKAVILLALCGALVPALAPPARAQGVTIPTALPTSFPTSFPNIPGVTIPTALPSGVSVAPVLAPLATSAMHAEIMSILGELIANLPQAAASRVRGIPLKIDPGMTDINAFAGCDAQHRPFLAATEGLLHAMFAIAETKACDELDGAQSYEAYMNAVVPKLVAQTPGSPALPPNVVPTKCAIDVRVLSRARENFDDMAAFTFAHELAHHYLGHTGCAINDSPFTQGLATVEHLSQSLVPAFNQPNELAADTAGLYDTMDTGLARRPRFQWSDRGALMLLDFFARLEGSGVTSIGFTHAHPPSALRESWIRTAATTWRFLHP